MHPHVRAISDAGTAKHGRPRKVPLTAVMAVAYLHAMTRPTHMTVTAMLRTLDLLGPSQREHLGVPRDLHVRHKHLWGGLRPAREDVEPSGRLVRAPRYDAGRPRGACDGRGGR